METVTLYIIHAGMRLAEPFPHVFFFLLIYTHFSFPVSLSFPLAFTCILLFVWKPFPVGFCFPNSYFSCPWNGTSVITCWDPSVSQTLGIPRWARPTCPIFIRFSSSYWFTCLNLPVDCELPEVRCWFISNTNTVPDN